MYPVIFQFTIPKSLQNILPDVVSIYSYGLLIALGTVLAYTHTAYFSKKQYGVSVHKTTDLVLLLIFAAVIGGKFFFFFEDPAKYLTEPKLLLQGFENGFVFFGSLLFCIPTMLWFFKQNNLPILGMLDIMALTTCIVHVFGRMGCFFAGCCYGLPTDQPWGITFEHPQSHAQPLNTPLHPSQLYSVLVLGTLIAFLWKLKKKKAFNGQVFLLYLILYSTARIFLEIFRGDYARGFIIEDVLTHSQLIALLVITIASAIYWQLKKKYSGAKAI